MALSEPNLYYGFPLYVYKPLTQASTPKRSSSVRILRLRPAGDDYLEIDCEILEAGVDSNGDPGVQPLNSHEATKIKDDGSPENITYEALSWCWGNEKADQLLRIHEKDTVHSFRISQNLKWALWALRKTDKARHLWVDAICINQNNYRERNEQVPRMDKIYGKATNVCIWLGMHDDNSKLAMDFIKEKVLRLWEFDKLIEDRRMASQWASLITLMKRPWFSRRWVVQEIALSHAGGTLHCGKDEVPWQDFADAVSLFVEVESATHRLSDVMKTDRLFNHIPDFFGDVSSLGAALLVDATSNLFRNSSDGERKPLSTLEYLVSRLSVFEATQPRDTIYALLAIAKDTTPQNLGAPQSGEQDGQVIHAKKAVKLLATKFASQPYNVNYKLPVIDVFQEFIEFSIRKSEETKAPGPLDIICRPWAPSVMRSHDDPAFLKQQTTFQKDNEIDEEIPLPSWIPSLSGAASEMEEHPTVGLRMERQNADPLVGMLESGQRSYSASGTTTLDIKKLKFKKWESPRLKADREKLQDGKTPTRPNSRSEEQDPTPQDAKNVYVPYPAYSMFVEGFVLDEVASVGRIASNGNMPFSWLAQGGWANTDENPPDQFWRTLVADRGPRGRNPPTYFPRACKESMKFKAKTKAKLKGNLDTKRLINEGRCTIVAEFLRRMQAVIWNRLLMKTKSNNLGLVGEDIKPGYLICILYGCTVPVILEKVTKSDDEIENEQNVAYEEWLDKREKAVDMVAGMYLLKKQHRKVMEPHVADAMNGSAREKATFELATAVSEVTKQAPGYSTDGGESVKPHIDAVPGTRRGTTKSNETPRSSNGFMQSSPIHPEVLSKTNLADDDSELPSPSTGDVSLSQPLPQPEPSEAEDPQELAEPPALIRSQTQAQKEAQKEAEAAAFRDAGRRECKEHEAKRLKQAKPERNFYYRLWGECYVHGMMNGEAIAVQNSRQGKKSQMFELR